MVSRYTTLVPSLGLRIGPACEAGLSAGMWREHVHPKRESMKDPINFKKTWQSHIMSKSTVSQEIGCKRSRVKFTEASFVTPWFELLFKLLLHYYYYNCCQVCLTIFSTQCLYLGTQKLFWRPDSPDMMNWEFNILIRRLLTIWKWICVYGNCIKYALCGVSFIVDLDCDKQLHTFISVIIVIINLL